MSAYTMDPKDIGRLAAFVSWCFNGETEGRFDTTPRGRKVVVNIREAARILAATNCESVGYRYSHTMDEAAEMAGLEDFADYVGWCVSSAEVEALNAKNRLEGGEEPFNGAEMVALVKCWRYQASEAPGFWETRPGAWAEHCLQHAYALEGEDGLPF